MTMKRMLPWFALATSLLVAMSAMHLRAAEPSSGRGEYFHRTSELVASYLDQLADVKCTERVVQEKLSPNSKVEQRAESTFDYLIMMSGSDDELSVNESRIAENSANKPARLPFLVTNGFSTLFLVFHPYYRDGFAFSDEGDDYVNNQRLHRIHFEHLRGRRTPVALMLRGREYPLDIVGTAWIDPTGYIVRLESKLAAPMDDIGLKVLSASVNYEPVRLPGAEATVRFPSEATVEVETRKQHWRNIHRFSNYKEFSVSTEVKVNDDIKK